MNSSTNQVVDGYSQPILDDPNLLLVLDEDIDLPVASDGMSRTVPGQAVAPSSRVNTSRCDRKCRFPSVGGLHRSSNDSSIRTASTTFPIWCHVDKSKSPSSTRTRVAALAYISKQNHPKRSTSHRRQLNESKKFCKQRSMLKDVKVPTIAFSNVKQLDSNFIQNTVIICDGGTTHPTINAENYTGNVCILSLSRGDLWVHDTQNPLLGLRMHFLSTKFPIFIRLPRQKSLSILNDDSAICQAMNSCARTQPQSLVRGSSKQVFNDGQPARYFCVGSQPSRAERGVKCGLYKLKYGFPSSDWDTVLNLLQRAEYAFDMFASTDMIRHIVEAKKRVPFLTMAPSPYSSSNQHSARYYNGAGFGVNVFLRCHVDNDFTMSIVQVHMDRCYQDDDPIVCYFCFPRIGCAVALRPGDILMFNPQEPHCISSRCNSDDQVYCISCYLKTRVVGLNDNSNLTI